MRKLNGKNVIYYLLFSLITVIILNSNLINAVNKTYYAGDLDSNYNVNGKISIDQGESTLLTYGPYEELSRGKYTVDIYYETNVDTNGYDVYSNNFGKILEGNLKANSKKISFDVFLNSDIKDLEVRTFYSGNGYLNIEKVIIKTCGLNVFNQFILTIIWIFLMLILCITNKEDNLAITIIMFNFLIILILKKLLLLNLASLIVSGCGIIVINLLLKKEKLNKKHITLLGIVIGITIFSILLGMKIVDPLYTEWLISRGGDPAQHFLGWNFYRNSSWKWPITLMDNYGYPNGTLVGYTDSIPLLAIPFKIINFMLPDKFQYIGIFLMICYILQGFIAAKISSKLTENKYVIACITVICCTSSIMLYRATCHEALAAHWIILWAIYVYIAKKNSNKIWFVIFPISILIHPYYLPMIYFVYVLFLIDYYRVNQKFEWKKWIITNIIILFTMFLCGYIGGGSGEGTGYGVYSFNLNSFINPESWSTIFKARPILDGQYEGINYLGAGIILLAIIVLINSNFIFPNLKNRKLEIFISILLILFAASNIIAFDNTVLIKYPLISVHKVIGGIFRSSGRLVWPIYYFIIFYLFRNITKKGVSKKIIIIISCVLLLQIYDYKDKFYEIRNIYNIDYVWNEKLKDPEWDQISKKYKSIVLTENNEEYIYFARFASDNKMNLNCGYFARTYNGNIDVVKEARNDILNNNINNQNIYILLDDETKEFARTHYKNRIKELDGYMLLLGGIDE